MQTGRSGTLRLGPAGIPSTGEASISQKYSAPVYAEKGTSLDRF